MSKRVKKIDDYAICEGHDLPHVIRIIGHFLLMAIIAYLLTLYFFFFSFS